MMKIMAAHLFGDVRSFFVFERSGVYIVTSSLVGIVQQLYLNRTHPLQAPAKPTRAKN